MIKDTIKYISRAILIVTGIAIFACSTFAQNGSSAYNFLELPTSAHAFALGGGSIALIDDDISLVDQNPALLGPEIEKQVGFTYMHWLGASNFASVRYGMAAGERGAWAIGLRYLNYGSITATDPDGTVTGSFSPQDIVFEGAYSHDFTDKLRGGIMLNGIYSNYEQYSAFALGVDLGINYYNDENDLSLSAVIKNLGGQIKRFNNTYDRLPFDIRLGYMQSLGSSPFSLSITAHTLTKWGIGAYAHDENKPEESGKPKSNFMGNLFGHLNIGLQYNPSDKFYLALGYNHKTKAEMSTYQRNFLSGFTVGAGLKARAFGVNVAYAMPHKGGSSLMLNLSLSFAELLN
ncbi:MAG: type IX secretion system protein PorQ [Prevotella sp.]|nr:type IX secretion system protein PorQ [Bacteroides sp.]MCM1367105.1 type IX secretion system protein PorQ [Prevotella sp.]MCM1437433.1 type IX secretion system protein PorQ [Prevotella sp.]